MSFPSFPGLHKQNGIDLGDCYSSDKAVARSVSLTLTQRQSTGSLFIIYAICTCARVLSVCINLLFGALARVIAFSALMLMPITIHTLDCGLLLTTGLVAAHGHLTQPNMKQKRCILDERLNSRLLHKVVG